MSKLEVVCSKVWSQVHVQVQDSFITACMCMCKGSEVIVKGSLLLNGNLYLYLEGVVSPDCQDKPWFLLSHCGRLLIAISSIVYPVIKFPNHKLNPKLSSAIGAIGITGGALVNVLEEWFPRDIRDLEAKLKDRTMRLAGYWGSQPKHLLKALPM